ncbi:hypothetical protein HYH03_011095 [Edaphochlamys debaryana]|uniref:Uncharacterized protein n=1 Tax=Edaphochlamys debaryana TaxID=47281 RepID=A0A836BVH7_9CHLO|nr:hypothetical protein HYH03_011095 [Edaphochlamys debaryana]|eukprot:KAG2490465.1 hypothetical protein HYH03_011095 [Edaphochlamys debaryana]
MGSRGHIIAAGVVALLGIVIVAGTPKEHVTCLALPPGTSKLSAGSVSLPALTALAAVLWAAVLVGGLAAQRERQRWCGHERGRGRGGGIGLKGQQRQQPQALQAGPEGPTRAGVAGAGVGPSDWTRLGPGAGLPYSWNLSTRHPYDALSSRADHMTGPGSAAGAWLGPDLTARGPAGPAPGCYCLKSAGAQDAPARGSRGRPDSQPPAAASPPPPPAPAAPAPAPAPPQESGLRARCVRPSGGCAGRRALAMLAAALLAAGPYGAMGQTNIATLTVKLGTTIPSTDAEGYFWMPLDSKPSMDFTPTGSGQSTQYNALIWYNFMSPSGGNGPISKGGNPLIKGNNGATVAFTPMNETGITSATGGLLAGCYVFRAQLVIAGTMTYVGSAASVGVRVGNFTGNCTNVVNTPPNCDTSKFIYNPPIGWEYGNATVGQPTTGSNCTSLTMSAPAGSCSDSEGTSLSYTWEAYLANSTTVQYTKYGMNVTFTTGLPGLELYPGLWNIRLTIKDNPVNVSLTQTKVLNYNFETVNLCYLNYVPSAPSLTLSSTCGTNVTVTANSSDPNMSPLTYQFLLYNAGGSVVRNSSYLTANSTTYSTTGASPLALGTYTVTCAALPAALARSTFPAAAVSTALARSTFPATAVSTALARSTFPATAVPAALARSSLSSATLTSPLACSALAAPSFPASIASPALAAAPIAALSRAPFATSISLTALPPAAVTSAPLPALSLATIPASLSKPALPTAPATTPLTCAAASASLALPAPRAPSVRASSSSHSTAHSSTASSTAASVPGTTFPHPSVTASSLAWTALASSPLASITETALATSALTISSLSRAAVTAATLS